MSTAFYIGISGFLLIMSLTKWKHLIANKYFALLVYLLFGIVIALIRSFLRTNYFDFFKNYNEIINNITFFLQILITVFLVIFNKKLSN